MDTVLPDLTTDPAELALALVNTPSVSGDERALSDAVEAQLRQCAHLEVSRSGDTVVARTHLGRAQRVVIAGHLDTVPVSLNSHNVPGRLETRAGEQALWGRGSVDMKSGVAAQLHLAAMLETPRYDVTWVFYDHEEVTGDLNGLGRTMAAHPEWIDGDFAILGEPTDGGVEGGCNGTLRLILTVPGIAAHSGRAWRGDNAVHKSVPILANCANAPVRDVEVEGLVYKESFSVVKVAAGIATNTVPDECKITVNYRFAPDLSDGQALLRALQILNGTAVEELAGPQSAAYAGAAQSIQQLVTMNELENLHGIQVNLDDLSSAARPGLDSALGTELLALVRQHGGAVGPKYGWTDVARFSAMGIPAVNLGPGDPMLCHTDDEHCPVSQIHDVVRVLSQWLS